MAEKLETTDDYRGSEPRSEFFISFFFFFLTEIVHDCQDYALRYSGIRRLSLLQLTCVVVRLIELNEAFTAVRFI